MSLRTKSLRGDADHQRDPKARIVSGGKRPLGGRRWFKICAQTKDKPGRKPDILSYPRRFPGLVPYILVMKRVYTFVVKGWVRVLRGPCGNRVIEHRLHTCPWGYGGLHLEGRRGKSFGK